MMNPKSNNIVYMSELLKNEQKYTLSHKQLIKLLQKHNVKYDYIKATKDIWCRDYMPIQINQNKFVQFRYEPSYLKDDLNLQTDTKKICEENGIDVIFSDINLDGGNIVSCSDKAILTDRIFNENPHKNKSELINELEKLLEVEVIIIPQINKKTDMTGHADGMVRFVDNTTVLVNNREKDFKYIVNGINKAMKKHNIECIDIPFFEHKSKKYPLNAIGCYMNFLEIKDLIVLPIFEVENNHDEEAKKLFKEIFKTKNIETVNYNEVGFEGGLLNCTTWTINGSVNNS